MFSQASRNEGYRAVYAARDVALIGIMTGLLTAVKMALAALPNIEGVTLLLMVYTVTFGWKRAMVSSVLFTTVQIIFYGINTWVIMYYINWPLLVAATYWLARIIRPLETRSAAREPRRAKGKIARFFERYGLPAILYSLLAGIFGFTFGFLCALVQPLFFARSMGYFPYMITYWLNGLTFDAVHGVSNFVIALVLMGPLLAVFASMKHRFRIFDHIKT